MSFFAFDAEPPESPLIGLPSARSAENRAKLSAFCERCDTFMHKPFLKARVAELSQYLELTITRLGETL